jgi:hypothetical protein
MNSIFSSERRTQHTPSLPVPDYTSREFEPIPVNRNKLENQRIGYLRNSKEATATTIATVTMPSSRNRSQISGSSDPSYQTARLEQQQKQQQEQPHQRGPSISSVQRESPPYDTKTVLSSYHSRSSTSRGTIGGDNSNRSNLLEMLQRDSKVDEDNFKIENDDGERGKYPESTSLRTVTTHSMMESSESNFGNPLDDLDETQSHCQDHKKRRTSTSSHSNSHGENEGDTIVEVETKEKSKANHLFHSLQKRMSKFREACGRIVNDDRVQLGIVFLIVLNAIMMGIGTFDFVTDDPDRNQAWETTDKVFLLIFTVELAMQLVYHGVRLFADAWLFFDFFIIVLSWSLESLQIIRAFRIFRAFRLVTRLTILKNLVVALFAVAPSMSAIIALLVLILYIYAVMCTVLFKDLYEQGVTDQNYFGRLDSSLFTLFQMMTLEWAEIVRQVMEKYYWAWLVFSTFLVITSLILYSLVIAVVCDAVKYTEHHDEVADALEEKQETHVRLRDLYMKVDQMAAHQTAAMAAIQFALQEMEDLGAGPDNSMERNDNGSSQHTGTTTQRAMPPPVIPLHGSARQRHNLEPGNDVKALRKPVKHVGSLPTSDDEIFKTVTFSRGAIGSHSARMEDLMSASDSDNDESGSKPALVFETDSDK